MPRQSLALTLWQNVTKETRDNFPSLNRPDDVAAGVVGRNWNWNNSRSGGGWARAWAGWCLARRTTSASGDKVKIIIANNALLPSSSPSSYLASLARRTTSSSGDKASFKMVQLGHHYHQFVNNWTKEPKNKNWESHLLSSRVIQVSWGRPSWVARDELHAEDKSTPGHMSVIVIQS